MYENLLRLSSVIENSFGTGRDRLLYHAGNDKFFVLSHEQHADLAARGVENVRPIAPLLFRRIADARNMRFACRHLTHAGDGAGPNGRRLATMCDRELRGLCRALASSVRKSTYRPGGVRRVRIRKNSGEGHRELQIKNIEDRIVDRAVVQVLQPVLDPQFSTGSFGSRPGLGTADALTAALAIANTRGHWCWVMADVANAFDAIPCRRLLDACSLKLPVEIVALIQIIIGGDHKRGIAQGSPLSPLLANVFFDKYLDQPWLERGTGRALIRYVDDLLVQTDCVEDAQAIKDDLCRLAKSGGTPVKQSAKIVDLRSGSPVQWLGFELRWENSSPAIRIGQRSWQALENTLLEIHLSPAAPLRATKVVQGWLDFLGPCFHFEDHNSVVRRIHGVVVKAGFDGFDAAVDLIAGWERASLRWRKRSGSGVEIQD